MPSQNSLAALSRLSNFSGRGGDGGMDTADWLAMNDALDLQTGLSYGARKEQAQQQAEAEAELLDQRRQMGRIGLRQAESRFLGPEGWARDTPEDAAFARGQQHKRLGLDLDTELQPRESHLADLESEAKAARARLPEASALHERDMGDLMEKLQRQYVDPQEARTDLAIEQQRLRNEGNLNVANARATSAQDRATKILSDFIRRGTRDDQTGQTRPFTTDELSALTREYGIDLPSPKGGTITEADIQAAMSANQWTREQAIQEAAKRGFTVR